MKQVFFAKLSAIKAIFIVSAFALITACSGGTAESAGTDNGGNTQPPTGTQPNQAPSVEITSNHSQSVTDAQAVMFIATATDAEDGDLSSIIQWRSSIDGSLGNGASVSIILSAGEHQVTATVRDQDGESAQASVYQVVVAANQMPQLTLLAPTSTDSFDDTQAITFQAQAVDDYDGDISANIEWSSNLDGVFGQGAEVSSTLSAGTHEITLRVNDSDELVAEQSFTLEVAATYGIATVFWTAPTQNTDDSELTDLVGFKVYYGVDQQSLDTVVEVLDPQASSVLIEQLPVGSTYYFTVTAINEMGIESDWSAVASKTL